MKSRLSDAHRVVRKTVVDAGFSLPYSFDALTLIDASPLDSGSLINQDGDFLVFDVDLVNTYRVGPSLVSPTRVLCELNLSYYTKTPGTVRDCEFLENVASIFAERTVEGVRFRTFLPFSERVVKGFTLLRV